MKKTVLVLFFLMTILVTFTSPTQARADTNIGDTVVVGVLTHKYIWLPVSEPTGIYGQFVITAGTDISFFIANDYNYHEWLAGRSASAYDVQNDVAEGTFKHFLTTGEWYIVFNNGDSLFTVQTIDVDLYKDETAPIINWETRPTNGETIPLNGAARFVGTAVDAQFPIDTVEIFVNNVMTYQTYSGYFVHTWEPSHTGTFTVRIEATDDCGNKRTEELILIVEDVPMTTSSPSYTSGTMGISIGIEVLIIPGIFIAIVGAAVYRSRRSKYQDFSNMEVVTP